MGAEFSKKTDDGGGAPMLDQSSYEDDCPFDPYLQTFDVELHKRTSGVINALAVGMEVRSLSLESFREVTAYLLEMNQLVVQVVRDSQKDIRNTPELSDLAEGYLENSHQTLDFCNDIKWHLTQAREGPAARGRRYPFTAEFFQRFCNQQVSLLSRLPSRKRKLDKMLRTVKVWRRISNAIFVTAKVVLLVCSVAAAAMTAPPVAAAVAAAASAIPLESMSEWVESMFNAYEAQVKRRQEVVGSTEVDTAPLLVMADFGGGVDVVWVSIAMLKQEKFMETMDELCRHADECSQDVERARTVLEKIIRHRTNRLVHRHPTKGRLHRIIKHRRSGKHRRRLPF